LHCFRCQSTFHDLIAALGLDEPERQCCQFEPAPRRPSADVAKSRSRLGHAWADSLTSRCRDRALACAARVLLADPGDLARLGTGEAGGRLVFAIRDDNHVLIGLERYAMPGSSARGVGVPKLLAVSGSRRSLWPAPGDVQIGDHLPGTLMVCEGPPTAVTLAGCGFTAVSFPNASGLTPGDAARIAERFRKAILLGDADAVGRAGASASAGLLRECGVDALAIDLFPGIDDKRDVGDALRARAAHESLTSIAAGAWLAHRLEVSLGAA
jgi:hypothetical protein